MTTAPLSRRIALLGAPSSIGIRPYDDGSLRTVHQAPARLRELGLAARLGADDAGDVAPPPYVDIAMPPSRVRNEPGVAAYCRELAERIAETGRDGTFVLLLAGECSVALAGLLAAGRRGRAGLAYLDAHADFATGADTTTGSPAGMALSLAIGRGDSPLARLDARGPLVARDDVVVIGRRDRSEETGFLPARLPEITAGELAARGPEAAAREALARLGGTSFWIHLDADLIDPRVMPAVDSPEAGGPDFGETAALLRPLVRHPGALGLGLTIYDPGLDRDGAAGRGLVRMFEEIF